MLKVFNVCLTDAYVTDARDRDKRDYRLFGQEPLLSNSVTANTGQNCKCKEMASFSSKAVTRLICNNIIKPSLPFNLHLKTARTPNIMLSNRGLGITVLRRPRLPKLSIF